MTCNYHGGSVWEEILLPSSLSWTHFWMSTDLSSGLIKLTTTPTVSYINTNHFVFFDIFIRQCHHLTINVWKALRPCGWCSTAADAGRVTFTVTLNQKSNQAVFPCQYYPSILRPIDRFINQPPTTANSECENENVSGINVILCRAANTSITLFLGHSTKSSLGSDAFVASYNIYCHSTCLHI